jgi:hypothetical protein
MVTPLELREWIKRDFGPRMRLLTGEDPNTIEFMSGHYLYRLDIKDDWMGCTCRTRFNVPGKGHPEFADLPDGKLTEDTWRDIAEEIKGMERRRRHGRAH